jgi:hypothetical protein
MPAFFHDRENATHAANRQIGRLRRGLPHRWPTAIIVFFALTSTMWAAPKLQLAASGTGFAIAGVAPAYTASFGTMNALAFGTPAANVNATALSNGALYFTTLNASIQAIGPNTGVIKAYVSTNFIGNAASAMIVYGCAAPSACTSAGQFSALGTSQAGATALASGLNGGSSAANVGLAIFLPDNDGASAFTGLSALGCTVTFDLYLNGSGTSSDTVTLALPNETVQSAVQLTVGSAAGGLTIGDAGTPLSDPFSMNFGNVNALGIGPAAGLTTVAQAGGIIYSTPYNILPVFTNINQTSASVKACVSTTFTHSVILSLRDSASGSVGTFSNISTNCGAATSLTASAGNRSTVARYLGLFISNVNGATAFTGLDSATLTYTLTVP